VSAAIDFSHMGRRLKLGKPSTGGLVVYGVLIIGIIVGLIVPGGTGNTIVAISGGLLALVVLGTIGIGKAATDSVDRRGRRYGPPM
jgi:hypothetical protein